MRKDNNRAVRNVMLNTLRVAALVICFVLVFGFALTSDIFDLGSNGANTYDNIAEAAGFRYALDKDGAVSLGTATPITGDNGALTATNFGFQSTSSANNTNSWTFTETFDNFEASLSNHQVYKTSGNTDLYTDLYSSSEGATPGGSPRKNHLNFGVLDGAAPQDGLIAVINYDTSGLLRSLINHPGFTVKASFSAWLNSEEVRTPCIWAVVSESGKAASAVGNPNGNTTNSGNQKRCVSNEVTLTAKDPYLTMCAGASYKYTVLSKERWIIAQDFELTFTITVNSGSWADSANNAVIDDYAAPALASAYEANTKDSYYPYRTSSNQLTGDNAWKVWDTSLSSALNSALDSPSKLRSYTNVQKTLASASSLTGNGRYYKSSSQTYVDMYDYNNGGLLRNDAQGNPVYSTPVVGDSVDARFASGLKTVQVGNADNGGGKAGAIFNIWEIANGATTAPKEIYVDGATVGYATVKRTNRTRVVVDIYMFDNARVVTSVTDFGNLVSNNTIDYSGIDTGKPNTTATLADDIGAIQKEKTNLTQWWRLNSYIAEGSGDSGETDIAPLVFYYSVQKSDTLSGLNDLIQYGSITALMNAGIIKSLNELNPIGVGSFVAFEYNFTSGTARGITNNSPRVGNAGSLESCKGVGYYMFSIYTADLAGNIGGASHYYVKVDSEQNVYDLTYGYTDAQDNPKQILPANNGAWATGSTTLSFAVGKYSLSGNSLLLMDAMDTVVLNIFFHKDENSGKIDFKINGTSVSLVNGGLGEYYIAGMGTVVLKFSEKSDKPVFELSLGNDLISGSTNEYVMIDSVIKAYLYTGEYDETADQSVSFTQSGWQSARFDGLALRVDRNAPVKPEMRADDDMPEGSLNESGSVLELPKVGNRVWFTNSNYLYNSIIDFVDDMADEYEVVVHFGIKNVTVAEGFSALNSFAANYKTASSADVFDISGSLNSFSETGESLQLTLRQDLGAGMRVIFIWAVDQAGNYSDLNSYYILADGTNYTVNSALSSISAGRFGVNAASVTVTNEQGQTASTFKRGEKVVFGFHPNDGFVPYTFVKLAGTSNEVNLLKNDTATSNWEIDNVDYQLLISLSGTEAAITVDDLDNFAALFSNSSGSSVITYTFAFREVVTYDLANNTVSYTGAPTIVPIGNFSDPDVDSNMFDFKFKQKNDNEYTPLDQTPSAVGDYKVTISINDTYIIYYAVTPIEYEYTIIAGVASVTAEATTSTYGTAPVLKYNVTGMSSEDANRIRGSIKLRTDVVDLDKLPAGQYQIIINEVFELENYTIGFTSAYHTVLSKDVTVNMSSATKSYGDAEPDYFFTLDKTALVGEDKLFDNINIDSEDDSTATYNVTGYVTRTAGENVGEYEFSKSVANFSINSNYNVIINTENNFTITHREIQLGTSGQSAVAQSGFDPAEGYKAYTPQYTIPAVQNAMSAEIRAVAQVKFSGTYETVGENGSYSATYNYAIVFAESSQGVISNDGKTLTTSNFILNLTADAYAINVANAETIVISAKNPIVRPLTSPEGLVFGDSSSSIVPFSYTDGEGYATNFSISGLDAKFNATTGKITINEVDYTVSWTLAHNAGVNRLPAGDYTLFAKSITLMDGDGNAYSGSVLLDTFTLTITPLKVIVRPVFAADYNYSRIYGSTDFVIGFEAYYINSANEKITITSGINGRFVRALYNDKNELVALGTIYDNVNSSLKENWYYGVAVGANFTASNRNIMLEVNTSTSDNAARFIVTPKSIVLQDAYFNGVSKPGDGTTNVPYNDSVKAIDLFTHGLIFSGDRVELAFTAQYDSPDPGDRTIIFSNLGLTGDDALNYYLAVEDNGEAIMETQSYTITKLTAGSDENITIYKADIVVRHQDFSFTKQYDGSTNISITNLTIQETAGNLALRNVGVNNMTIYGNYPSATVSDSMIGSSIGVFFAFSDNEAALDGIHFSSSTPNISIIKRNLNNIYGFFVTITNANMAITKRVINADSLTDIQAVDRDYNASQDIAINYTFAADALAMSGEWSTGNAVGLILSATASSKNAGEHKFAFSGYSLNESARAFYDVDLDSINAKYGSSTSVVISKAKLYPNISIAAANYSASSVISGISNNNGALTTLNYADKLASELSAFSYNFENVSFVYSINGAANGAVAFDIDGNVIRHNVLVSGLTITESGDNNYLANYELYGMRYENDKYIATGELISGEAVADYEMIEFAQLDKKEITIVSNSIKIEDKIYDGNTDAYATADKDVLDRLVFEQDRSKISLDIAARFATANVGVNIAVSITRLELVDNDGATNVARNYSINSELSTLSLRKDIKGAPLTFTAELQSKTYNNSNGATMSTNGYSLDGFIAGDTQARTYGVTTVGAYFDDANVRRDAEGTVINKIGTVYGLTLRTTGSGTNNYVLAYSSKTELSGKTVYHKVGEGADVTYYYLLDTKEINGAVYNYYTGWYETVQPDTPSEDTPSEDTPAATSSTDAPSKLGEARGVYGVINPKNISLSIEKIKEDHFAKQYDGTTKFFGKYGEDYTVTGITGVIPGDDAQIDSDSIVAEYTSSAVSANAYVMVSNVTLSGTSAGNYTYRSVSRQLPARIVAREVTAILADGEVEYGAINPDYSEYLSYQMAGKTIVIDNGAMYMDFNEFINCVGLLDGIEAGEMETFVANDKYIAQLASRRYTLDGDAYTQSDSGEFIRLVASFNNPSIITGVDNYTNVGKYTYKVNSIAAGNYIIKSADGVDDSQLIVIPATIYVHASIANYGMLYGQAIPTIAFRYLDANGNSGFRGRDREADVFTTRPTANFVLYNTATGKGANVSSLSKISADLNEGECYIVFVNIPKDGINSNYRVVAAYNYAALGDGENIDSRKFAVLTISLPTTIAGLSAVNASVEFNNADQGKSIISGLLPGDKVSYFNEVNGVWNPLEAAINKGVYALKVKVERPIVAASGDANNYYATWEGTATLTINAVSPSLSAPNVRVVYNGNLQSFDRASISAMVGGFDISKVNVAYQVRLANGQYDNVQAGDLINAGSYRVVLTYTSTGDDDNYLSNTYNVSFVINKITVNVTLTSDTTQLFDAEAGNTITYDLVRASGMPELAIPQTIVSFSNGEVGFLTKAGRYTFTINAIDAADANNFEFAGGSGVINVGVKTITSVDVDNNVNATINTNGDSTLVVEQFNVKYVYSGAITNTNDDDMYWASVNKFMSNISKQTDGVPTTLQAIVRMSLTYNTASVGLSEKVNISVRLPENVANDMDSVVVYTVNDQGRLIKLSNYTLSNGNISFETDYLGSLVFVKLGEEMPAWQLAIIIVVSVVAAGVLIGVIVGVVVKKKRNKKAA